MYDYMCVLGLVETKKKNSFLKKYCTLQYWIIYKIIYIQEYFYMKQIF